MALRMREEGTPLTLVCYGALVSVHAKAGDVDAAERWLQALLDANVGQPNTICINMIINACAKACDVPRAEAWIARARAIGVEADAMSYNAVIDACARSGDVGRAEAWLRRMVPDKGAPAPNL